MTQSSITNVRIPIIIPKRNKGEHEVFCSCNISTSTLTDVSNFVQYCTPLIKNVCSVTTPAEVAASIIKYAKIDDIDLDMHFFYHLDRASSNFKDSFYEMLCFYKVVGNESRLITEMGVQIPIRVKDLYVVNGLLTFSTVEPRDIYFEDILDHVQKFADIKIYPSVSFDDKKQLPFMIDVGMSAVDYINTLAKGDTIKKIGSTIKVNLVYPDIYNTHEISYKTTWSSL